MKRINIKVVGFAVALLLPLYGIALPKKADYPHWNFNNKAVYKKLVKIDNFIKANKGKGYIAGFDWDGTLYSESIPLKSGVTSSGQMAWYFWGASHLNNNKYPNIFPLAITADGKGGQHLRKKLNFFSQEIQKGDDSFLLFSQIATLEAGMTPVQMAQGIHGYLNSYPPKKYILYPVMDVMQRLIDNGFNVWLVTGSNPYYLSVMLQYIEKNINYTPTRKYRFNISTVPYNPTTGHIAGNGAMLSPTGKFSSIYDDRYLKSKPSKTLHIVDSTGKAVAIESYIKPRVKKPFVFFAGNSGGDSAAIKHLLGQKHKNVLALAINPRGSLSKLAKSHPSQLVEITAE